MQYHCRLGRTLRWFAVAALAGTVGCKSAEVAHPTVSSSPELTSATVSQSPGRAEERRFEEDKRAQLEAVDKRIQGLRDRSSTLSLDKWRAMERRLGYVTNLRNEFAAGLTGARDVSAAAWPTFKTNTNAQMDQLNQAVDDAQKLTPQLH